MHKPTRKSLAHAAGPGGRPDTFFRFSCFHCICPESRIDESRRVAYDERRSNLY